jgi:hypothetical protein
LSADPDFKPSRLAKGDVPFMGILFKKSQDFTRAVNAISRRRLF